LHIVLHSLTLKDHLLDLGDRPINTKSSPVGPANLAGYQLNLLKSGGSSCGPFWCASCWLLYQRARAYARDGGGNFSGNFSFGKSKFHFLLEEVFPKKETLKIGNFFGNHLHGNLTLALYHAPLSAPCLAIRLPITRAWKL
jgi:hypothetical protein